MVDKNLNYGRTQLKELAQICGKIESLLDLGAGFGVDLFNVKSVTHANKIYAVECFPAAVSKLKEENIEVFSINLESQKLSLSDESIDLVITNQFLEHTKELFWIMHEATRVLKPNGHLLVGVPNLASLHNRLLLALGRQPTPINLASAHVRGFTLPGFQHFLQEGFPGGYKLLNYKGSNFYPFPPLIAKPLAELFPTFAWGIFMLFQKQKTYKRSFLEYPIHEKLETNYYLGESSPSHF